jgi:DNA-binding NarL/FixJ family response regulator
VNDISKANSNNIASTLEVLSQGIRNGSVKNYSISQDEYTTTIQVGTGDYTYTRQQTSINGYTETTNITAPLMFPNGRQQIARELYNKGKTQQEIANQLGVSQKTISNDLKKN